VAEVLTHEAGHSLLFGLTVDEPLVLNLDDVLYPSPLREDPRPMDDIYGVDSGRGQDRITRNSVAAAS
jgi:HEXXH motif-containing protein